MAGAPVSHEDIARTIDAIVPTRRFISYMREYQYIVSGLLAIHAAISITIIIGTMTPLYDHWSFPEMFAYSLASVPAITIGCVILGVHKALGELEALHRKVGTLAKTCERGGAVFSSAPGAWGYLRYYYERTMQSVLYAVLAGWTLTDCYINGCYHDTHGWGLICGITAATTTALCGVYGVAYKTKPLNTLNPASLYSRHFAGTATLIGFCHAGWCMAPSPGHIEHTGPRWYYTLNQLARSTLVNAVLLLLALVVQCILMREAYAQTIQKLRRQHR